MSTPKHEYETVEGTKPTTYGAHEPRTVEHSVTVVGGGRALGDDTDLHMMTEIGDGVFVQWSNCRRCNKRVGSCKCTGGPVEPHYMKPWRDNRFKNDLNTRPDPSYPLIPSVIEWLEERGYKVTKKRETRKAEVVEVPDEVTDFEKVTGEKPREPIMTDPVTTDDEAANPDRETAADEHREMLKSRPLDVNEGVDPEKVDEGLNEALEKVRAAKERDTSDIEVDF